MKESKKSLKNCSEDICLLKTVINNLREDKETTQNNIQECLVGYNQMSLSLSNYREKFIELESLMKSQLKDANTKRELEQNMFEEKMTNRINTAIINIEEELKEITKRLNRNDKEVETRNREKDAETIKFIENIDTVEKNCAKELDSFR